MLNLIGLLKHTQSRKAKYNNSIIRAGFTLVELAIVLVIIGLLIGGVLVGHDLIKAAEIRSQITQIEKYNAAVNTFKLRTGYLPGDIPEPTASAFGFAARGQYKGQGDGDGLIAGIDSNSSSVNCGCFPLSGETVLFWNDLSAANLIEGKFNYATATSVFHMFSTDIPNYLPKSKIGENYISVGSGSSIWAAVVPQMMTGFNHFSISFITGNDGSGDPIANEGLSVNQGYSIDYKIDDGLPQSGKVVAQFWSNTGSGSRFVWAGTGGGWQLTTYTTATPASATTCFDNGNVGGGTQKYSVGTNGGNGINCALSFKFQ